MDGDFVFSVPVLVIGGGAAGAVAALAARAAGAEVLLAEQDAIPRGTTAMSQGLVCAAGTAQQAALGIADDAETLFADIMAKTRGATDAVIARAVATASGPCLNWLTEQVGVPFALDTGFRAAYGHSRQRLHGWPRRGGIDLVQLLHQRLAERGVDVLLQARLVDVARGPDGRVRGVTLERPDGSRDRIGCGALILASGGFAANPAMVAAHMPEAVLARHNGHVGNRGDGIRLGAALGGALADMASYQGYAMLADPQGITVPPGVIVEGGVLLNRRGERFVDETADIAGMVHPVLGQPEGIAWVVFDAVIEARNAYTLEIRGLNDLAAIRHVADIAALAALTGASTTAIATTLAMLHGTDAYGRNWAGERAPQPPFHAIRVCGGLYHTQGGLQIDSAARVLRADGSALPNLFAAGGAARGVSGPSYWGYLPAMGLGSAVTTGWLAGRAAAVLAG